ncbi:ABC transporter ATP-binding protein [Pigmentiphaga soli]|uniref:ABC transporter ATP-binding protein n=1 Tax=Pigmentiphaga soli TaxID=1007095 RepID=A0ABP8GQJ3_9BURK
MTELIVHNVHKKLGNVQVLAGASFTAGRGEIVALLGASGSGKTTLLRSIAGLEQPEAGRIEIGGKPVFDSAKNICLAPEEREIGLVFQSYALWPHKTVFENVAYGLRLRGVGNKECTGRVHTILERLGLGHLADRFPNQLSGGQQQRVALCRALVYNPKVLLLDEPLSNLDAKLREEARFWIRQLILQFQICAVVVTHDQAEALVMSDHVLLLSDGNIVQSGTPQEIYHRPATLFCAQFMGTNNLLDGQAKREGSEGSEWSIAGEGWSLRAEPRQQIDDGQPATAVIRVERVSITDQPGPNRLRMEIEGAAYMGEHWEYLLGNGRLKLRARSPVELPPGGVWCELPPGHLWIYPRNPNAEPASPLAIAAE